MIHYVSFEPTEYATYGNLKNRIGELLETLGSPDRVVYYLATPPVLYRRSRQGLHEAGLNVTATKKGWRRIIVEKPFGTDLEIGAQTQRTAPRGIRRKRRYTGSTTISARRRSKTFWCCVFRTAFSSRCGTATTSTGWRSARPKPSASKTGARITKAAGAMRDMVQNHLMQLMAFVAMEPPAVFEPEPIRNEIVKVFRAIRRYTPAEIGRNVLRAQYTGCEIDGQYVPGIPRREKRRSGFDDRDFRGDETLYRQLALGRRAFSAVPAKAGQKQSEVVVHFKSTPPTLFAGQCSGVRATS